MVDVVHSTYQQLNIPSVIGDMINDYSQIQTMVNTTHITYQQLHIPNVLEAIIDDYSETQSIIPFYRTTANNITSIFYSICGSGEATTYLTKLYHQGYTYHTHTRHWTTLLDRQGKK